MSNKFSKFAIGNSIGSIILSVLSPFIGIIFAALAIGLGIKALIDYKNDNSLGGKALAIISIVLGAIILLLDLISIIVRILIPTTFTY